MTDQYLTVGKSLFRKDAWDKTTGKALYTADIPVDGEKIGLVVRSPHHYARILDIDKKESLDIPGVLAVLTSDDIPGAKAFGSLIPDQPSLAVDVVRHLGEPVVLIIADTKQAAEKAANQIQVSYDPLTPVFDPVQAASDDAPKLHQDGNLVTTLNVSDGDIDQGFQEADHILEDTYILPRIHPGYMEPETSLAVWEEDQTITVWVSSQHPFTDQEFIAAALDLPVEKVRVKSGVIGGAFGGKEDSSLSI